jgi:CheY-like chemotaxis protein
MAATGRLLRRTLGEHIIVQTVGASHLWTTNVDRAQVETSLINLCINARDAMPMGGRLTIETKNVTLDRDYVLHQEDDIAAGEYVMLSVTDTGSGMTPDVAKRAFEPFFTTKEVGKGTGLGLSMVYGFIRQSNGHIKIYSEVGHGTSVKMYFPRSEVPAPATATARRKPMAGGTEHLLVVEDEEAVRAIVGEQLRSLGYDVKLAGDAEEALALLRRHHFDLVLTDVVMPGITGNAFAAQLRARRPGMKILFMSGYERPQDASETWPGEGVQVIGKPFSRAALLATVSRLLGTSPAGTGPG